MITKDDVHDSLVNLFGKELAEIWWRVPLPGFGGRCAENLWETGREDIVIQRVWDYHK